MSSLKEGDAGKATLAGGVSMAMDVGVRPS